MAKHWLITFYPEMAAPITVPALASPQGWNGVGDLSHEERAASASPANDHARAWALPSDERKPRVFRGEFAAIGGTK